MPFAFIGFFYASTTENNSITWHLFILIVLCMIFARSAAMAFNRWVDSNIDKENERTKNREIPAGKISSNSAFIFVIVNAALFIITTYFINSLCFYLSPMALLIILGYSYTKRFTALCHFILGLGLSLAPIGAYIAVTNEFHEIPILFSLVVLFWTGGFDIIYSLQDEVYDAAKTLHSIPSKLGRKQSLLLSMIVHVVAGVIVCIIGFVAELNVIYWIGTVLFISLLIYQHTIVKTTDISKVNVAFGTTNGIASIIYGVFTVGSFFIIIPL